MADEVDTTETEGPKQTIKRLPPEREVGPFYPSGMSAFGERVAMTAMG